MPSVAIAGGSGSLGRAFVEELSKSNNEVFILGRSMEAPSSGAAESQLKLIAAADKSTATKRYIPSEYGALATAENLHMFPSFPGQMKNALELEKTNLQWTRVFIGFFMDYFGMPHIKSTLQPVSLFIDMRYKAAALPGTGEDKFTLTYSYDLAKFVARLVDDESEWPRLSYISGQDVTFNQLLGLIEDTTGEKFQVTYDSAEKISKGEVTPLNDEMRSSEELVHVMANIAGMVIGGGALMGESEGVKLNERFPEVKALTAEEMVKNCWAK